MRGLLILVVVVVGGLLVTGGTQPQEPGFGTGVAKLETGAVVCTVGGRVVACISPALPAGLRKSLAAMLERGFAPPPAAPCPQPICPTPICYERTDPDDWLGVPNRPGADSRPQRAPH